MIAAMICGLSYIGVITNMKFTRYILTFIFLVASVHAVPTGGAGQNNPYEFRAETITFGENNEAQIALGEVEPGTDAWKFEVTDASFQMLLKSAQSVIIQTTDAIELTADNFSLMNCAGTATFDMTSDGIEFFTDVPDSPGTIFAIYNDQENEGFLFNNDLSSTTIYGGDITFDTVTQEADFPDSQVAIKLTSKDAALDITDGTDQYYTIDTRTTVDNVRSHTFHRADHAIASSATNEASLMRFEAWTLDYTGNTQVTSEVINLMGQTFTIAADGVGGQLTVDLASYLKLHPPKEGSQAILTDTTAIHIWDDGGTPVNQHGIIIDTLTVGANNYAITIGNSDADQNLIHAGVTGDPVFSWDESEDSFRLDKGLFVGDGTNDVEIEGDGDINFVAGAGLQFGEICYHDGGFNVVLAAQDTDYQVVGFNIDGESNGDVTPDQTNDHITIGKAGRYLITYSVSSRSATSNTYEFHLMYNNGGTDLTCSYTHNTIPVANKLNNSAITTIADLPASATVELWVRRSDGGAVSKTLTIERVNLTVTQVGGTT
jgi:hypothetical protein